MGKMNIGVAAGKITPNGPISLCGQFETRISRYVESDLMANCMVLEDGNSQLIICSLDLESVSRSLTQRIVELVEREEPEIDADAIALCCTHTHDGPRGSFSGEDHGATSGLRCALRYLPEGYTFVDSEAEMGGYLDQDEAAEQVAEAAAAVILKAWKTRRAGAFGPAFGRAVFGHSRRVTYSDGSAKMYGSAQTSTFVALEGGNDSGVDLLYLFDEAGRPLGALINVGCPSQVVEAEYYVSSDFWGKARARLADTLGPDFVLISVCAPAGDLSPRDLVRIDRDKGHHAEGQRYRPRREDSSMMYTLEGAGELGRRAASIVEEKLSEGFRNRKTEGFLETRLVHLDLPVRKVTPAEYETAKAGFYRALEALGRRTITPRDLHDIHVQSGEMYRFERQEIDRVFQTDIIVARLDDMAFATSPFELYLDYGNQIRARSWAAQTFLAQLTNDSAGYLPTEKAERGGHYSAYVSSGIVGHEGGAILVEKTLDVINELFEED